MTENSTLDVGTGVRLVSEERGEYGAGHIPAPRVEPEGARGRGRPSLGGQGRSPQVTFRAPPALRAMAEEQAARDGKTVSQLAREAFEMYLASKGGAGLG
ncbi:hypothetical protein ACWDWO_26630 [Actinopolymorpha singaporensis]|jgi:hypothetical protein|uniref:Ribbon-helix-helix protein, copG family n=1 Tax=Actinopolymorpha singaporensis TaxID=117157 RepID=A0A1H1QI09_9ACTN|nr:hypothetical protein [Actinopolymorpha singaporensis]SDS22957.1 hypothetical protein SAMN04489717_2020 [Actinopolymorpha singaporensis]